MGNGKRRRVELVVSVDSADAGYAALEYGAEAVCLDVGGVPAAICGESPSTDEGNKVNEIDQIAAYARTLSPSRRLYVGLDTLVPDGKIGELIELLGALADTGVDALVVRDLGVHRLVRKHFPALRVHAGAHLAVHDREGAWALARTGFARVASAPELSLDEISDVAAIEGVELEAPVHGALCYSYGGWCLFSSRAPGEGAGRGRCAERCRAAFRLSSCERPAQPEADGSPDDATAYPFSMKDLALADHLDDLISAGVDALGIEARSRSPLYVAAVTDFYRRLLDGRLPPGERARAEADIGTIFSRPWTDYFIDGRADRGATLDAAAAHRGTPIGEVESVTMRPGRPRAFLRFRTSRRLETHDGLRVETPGEDRPFGFAVETMHLVTKSRRRGSKEVFEAPAGSIVEVGLPEEYPLMPPGAVVRCSSSQEVKQRYGFARPKPGRSRSRRPIDVLVEVAPEGLGAVARAATSWEVEAGIEARVDLAGELDAAKDATNTERAARTAFEKLGDTRFRLGSFELCNPGGMFVPASVLNRLRRDVAASLEAKLAAATASYLERVKARAAGPTGIHAMDGIGQPAPSCESCASLLNAVPGEFRWSIKTDRLAHLGAFEADDWRGVHEVIVDIARDDPAGLHSGLERIAEAAGRDKVRLALPAITRAWERDDLLGKIAALANSGWSKWQIAGASGWEHLRAVEALDVTTDWPLYVTSRHAALELLDSGASGFTLSPPIGQVPEGPDRTWGEAVANCAELLEEFGAAATVVVYGDTPLFVSEACAHTDLAGGCPGPAPCRPPAEPDASGPEEPSFESVPMLSSFGDRIVALREGCRTVVIHRDPFCLSDSLDDLSRAGARSLRVDLVWRSYTPEHSRDIWRTVRRGDSPERAIPAPPARGSQLPGAWAPG